MHRKYLQKQGKLGRTVKDAIHTAVGGSLVLLLITRKRKKNIWQKILDKWESGLTAVWLKWDLPYHSVNKITGHTNTHIP